MANDVVIYGNSTCGYCGAARLLLTKKGVPFTDLLVNKEPELRREMQERSGRTSVPQIFIDDRHVGGFEELTELDANGELNRMLGID